GRISLILGAEKRKEMNNWFLLMGLLAAIAVMISSETTQEKPQTRASNDATQSGASAPAIPRDIAPFFAPPSEFAGQYGDYRSPLKFRDGSEVKSANEWKHRRAEILHDWQ